MGQNGQEGKTNLQGVNPAKGYVVGAKHARCDYLYLQQHTFIGF